MKKTSTAMRRAELYEASGDDAVPGEPSRQNAAENASCDRHPARRLRRRDGARGAARRRQSGDRGDLRPDRLRHRRRLDPGPRLSLVSFITLGTRDLAAARRFYVEGLGWEPTLDLEGEVCFIQVGYGVLLALWGAAELAEDSGAPVTAGDNISLARNVGSPELVDALIDQAAAAGARVLKPGQQAFFGGYHGYFADPVDGVRWEIAHNPGLAVDPDGTVHLGT